MSENFFVRKSVVIQAPVEHVFRILTEQHDLWWPRSHHIGQTESFVAKLEPRTGGRWYEESANGTTCDWGRVLVWEPPTRLILSWDISAVWQYDAQLGTEVDIRLTALSGSSTQVDLEHRKLDRYQDQANAMRAMLDSPNGWTGVLDALAKQCESSAMPRA